MSGGGGGRDTAAVQSNVQDNIQELLSIVWGMLLSLAQQQRATPLLQKSKIESCM